MGTIYDIRKECATKIRNTCKEATGTNINYYILLDLIMTNYGMGKKFLDQELTVMEKLGTVQRVYKLNERGEQVADVVKCI